jgi:hypothetical protein
MLFYRSTQLNDMREKEKKATHKTWQLKEERCETKYEKERKKDYT